MAWVFNRALVFTHRPGKIHVEEIELAEGDVRFGDIGVELQSFERSFFRFRERVAPARPRVVWKQDVGIGQVGIGQSIIGIARDSLLVKLNRFGNVFAGSLFP